MVSIVRLVAAELSEVCVLFYKRIDCIDVVIVRLSSQVRTSWVRVDDDKEIKMQSGRGQMVASCVVGYSAKGFV